MNREEERRMWQERHDEQNRKIKLLDERLDYQSVTIDRQAGDLSRQGESLLLLRFVIGAFGGLVFIGSLFFDSISRLLVYTRFSNFIPQEGVGAIQILGMCLAAVMIFAAIYRRIK